MLEEFRLFFSKLSQFIKDSPLLGHSRDSRTRCNLEREFIEKFEQLCEHKKFNIAFASKSGPHTEWIHEKEAKISRYFPCNQRWASLIFFWVR